MKTGLHFSGDGTATVYLKAETPGEEAILAFMCEGPERRWKARPSFDHRPSGVEGLMLERVKDTPDTTVKSVD